MAWYHGDPSLMRELNALTPEFRTPEIDALAAEYEDAKKGMENLARYSTGGPTQKQLSHIEATQRELFRKVSSARNDQIRAAKRQARARTRAINRGVLSGGSDPFVTAKVSSTASRYSESPAEAASLEARAQRQMLNSAMNSSVRDLNREAVIRKKMLDAEARAAGSLEPKPKKKGIKKMAKKKSTKKASKKKSGKRRSKAASCKKAGRYLAKCSVAKRKTKKKKTKAKKSKKAAATKIAMPTKKPAVVMGMVV